MIQEKSCIYPRRQKNTWRLRSDVRISEMAKTPDDSIISHITERVHSHWDARKPPTNAFTIASGISVIYIMVNRAQSSSTSVRSARCPAAVRLCQMS
jgi:hypothetical protein